MLFCPWRFPMSNFDGSAANVGLGRPCAAHLRFLRHKRQTLHRNFKWKAAQA
jgi:hypothetical protein